MQFVENILASGVLLTTPILLAAIGGLINRLGGIVNIGLEGKMLLGALIAIIVSASTNSWLLGLLAAGFASSLAGFIFSVLITRLNANMIIVGFGLNIFIAGLVGFYLKWFHGSSGTLKIENTVLLPKVSLPYIHELPLIGTLFSNKDPLTWISWIIAFSMPWIIFKTRLGMRIRCAGSDENVARSIGLNVNNLRDFSSAIAGFFAGLAGAHLSIGMLGLFSMGLISGRGFIALAAFYFGRNMPIRTSLVCLIFGILDSMQIRLQGLGLPSEPVQAIPWITVIGILSFMGWSEQRKSQELK